MTLGEEWVIGGALNSSALRSPPRFKIQVTH
jgi:hypothetical protein